MKTIGFSDKGQIFQVTVDELVNILSTQEKGTFFWMITETVPKMTVTGNPYTYEVVNISSKGRRTVSKKVNIKKVTEGCYLMGNNYSDRVEKENDLEEYIPKPCKVGNHISKCVLYNEKTHKYYLQYEVYKGDKPKSEYYHNGDVVEKSLLESYLIKSTPNPLKVIYPSVTVENIKRIHFNGNQYIVVNSSVENPTQVGVDMVNV